MKRMALTVAVLVAVLVSVPRPAHADADNVGAAALGFFLGTMVAPPPVVYGPPPAVVYEQPPRVVVQVPRGGYDGYGAPPVYYYRFRDYPHHDWHERRHHRRWQHYRHDYGRRHWRHWDDD